MTNQEIDKLEAGRPLDILIAIQVMGWTQSYLENHPDPLGSDLFSADMPPGPGSPLLHWIVLPAFSTRIEEAWRVVEKISELIYEDEGNVDRSYLMLAQCGHSISERKFVASFATIENEDEWYEKNHPFTAKAETAPLAICRAALKTVAQKWAPDLPGRSSR